MEKDLRKTNPNGINQYTEPDPRQIDFLKNYFNRKSDTFGNATASGIKAGYTEAYSKQVFDKMPKWLSKKVKKLKYSNLRDLAEENLREGLLLEAGVVTNRNGKIIEAKDIDVMKVKLDISKFVASRLNKKTWSERIEQTGADGKDLTIKIVKYGDNDSI